jgi:hypothetical protein
MKFKIRKPWIKLSNIRITTKNSEAKNEGIKLKKHQQKSDTICTRYDSLWELVSPWTSSSFKPVLIVIISCEGPSSLWDIIHQFESALFTCNSIIDTACTSPLMFAYPCRPGVSSTNKSNDIYLPVLLFVFIH